MFVASFVLAALVQGCTSTSTIKIVSNVPAEAFVLNADTEEEESAGSTPLAVTLDGRAKTYVLRAEGYAPQHVVVVEELPGGAEVRATLEPRQEDGVAAEAPEKTKVVRASRDQSRVLDTTLRVQRLFMRGQVTEARTALDRLSSEYGDTFSSLLLKGHLAGADGDFDGAAKFYRQLNSSRYDAAAGGTP